MRRMRIRDYAIGYAIFGAWRAYYWLLPACPGLAAWWIEVTGMRRRLERAKARMELLP